MDTCDNLLLPGRKKNDYEISRSTFIKTKLTWRFRRGDLVWRTSKFNGACLRPPIPRHISGNVGEQFKFVDDATQIASVNLKQSLIPDPINRSRPLNFHEQTEMIWARNENVLQGELDRFAQFTKNNKLVINKSKCFVMQMSRSRKYDFPPEFSVQDSEILEVKKTHKILGV